MFIKNFICLIGLLLCVNSNAQVIEELGVFPEDYHEDDYSASRIFITKEDSIIVSFVNLLPYPQYILNYVYRDGLWEIWSDTLFIPDLKMVSMEFDEEETEIYVTCFSGTSEVQLIKFNAAGNEQVGQTLFGDISTKAYTIIDSVLNQKSLFIYRNDSIIEYNYNETMNLWNIGMSKLCLDVHFAQKNDNSYVFDYYNSLPIVLLYTGSSTFRLHFKNSSNYFAFGPNFNSDVRMQLYYHSNEEKIYLFYGNTVISRINCVSYTIEDVFEFNFDGLELGETTYFDDKRRCFFNENSNLIYFTTGRIKTFESPGGVTYSRKSTELNIYDLDNESLSNSTFGDSVYIYDMAQNDDGDVFVISHTFHQASPTSLSTKIPGIFKISNIYLNQESKEIKEPSIFIQNKFDSFDIQTENSCELRVYGLNGALLQTYRPSINFTLDKSNFVPGMYLLRFDFEDNTSATRKVVMN